MTERPLTKPSLPHKRRRLGLLAVLAGLTLVAAPAIWAQAGSKTEAQSKKEADEAKYRIKPTLDKDSPTGVAIPKDLDAAFLELDRMLTKELRDEMRKGSERNMAQYHFGLGMWMRNNWGFWKDLDLAKWFNKKGVFHPDDMSGVVLTSYWRCLNGKRIDLAGQVKVYQDYWKAAAKEAKVEKARVAKAEVAIKRMMIGLTVDPSRPKIVHFPKMKTDGVRIRYAALFRDGVLLTAKRFSAESIRREPDFFVRSFYLDLKTYKLHPVTISENDQVEDSVVVNGHAYLNCVKDVEGRILDVFDGKRSFIPWPAFGASKDRPIRLGIERSLDGSAVGLLAVGNGKLARWEGGRWVTIPCGKATFPDCVLPPEKIGNRLTFHDEGYGENNKALSWIDLSHPKGLVRFDKHVGVVGSEGPRWENVWDYVALQDGSWWISTGSDSSAQSLLRWTPSGGYRVALFNNSIKWTGGFFATPDKTSNASEYAATVTGLMPIRRSWIAAIGPQGLLEVQGQTLRRIIGFEGAPDNWTPTKMLGISQHVILMGGHWGGIFLLERTPERTPQVVCVDDQVVNPIVF